MSRFSSSIAASLSSASATNPNAKYSNELADIADGDMQSDDQSYTSSIAASLSSASATNPNAKYSNELADIADSDIQSDDQSCTSKQQVSNARPSWPDKFDRKGIQAQVCWGPNEDIHDMSLSIHWARQSAFITLYTRVSIIDAQGTSKRHKFIYIHIDPKQIQQLLFTAHPEYNPRARLRRSTVAFDLFFREPPILILPKNVMFSQEAGQAINTLHNLIQQSSFTIYAVLPTEMVPHEWVQQFCEGITKQKFIAIPRLANWKILYKGDRGEAMVIKRDDPLELVIDPNEPATPGLPTYQEVEQDNPLTHSTNKKRPGKKISSAQTVQGTLAVQAFNIRKLEESFSARERALEARERALEARERALEARKRALDEEFSARKRALKARKLELNEKFSARKRALKARKCALEEKFSSVREPEDFSSVRERALEERLFTRLSERMLTRLSAYVKTDFEEDDTASMMTTDMHQNQAYHKEIQRAGAPSPESRPTVLIESGH
ncbi:hypothetical protein GGI35DRAFT_490018 [Trichoderma velutinum]